MGHSRAAEIALPDVEHALAKSPNHLRFPRAIEARFEADTSARRCRHFIGAMLMGLLVYDLLLISNYRMLPDVFMTALTVKLGLVTPAVLAIVLVLRRQPPPWLRECLPMIPYFAITCGSMYIILKSSNPLAAHAHYPLVMALIYANLVQRMRFWQALATSLASLILYPLAISHLRDLPPEAFAGAVTMMALAGGCSLFTNFVLERDERRNYLLTLRDEITGRWLARANEELSRISSLDPLTALTNRRGLDQRMPALWAEAAQRRSSVCVLMLDVDHFKLFNDRYGHQSGDDCLRQVAETAHAEVRATNGLIARFGGEEFVVVMAGAELRDGIALAQRIRTAIEATGVPHDCVPGRTVTVSIGVAAAPAMLNGSPKDLMEMADAALYMAKKKGRNQVWPAAAAPGPEPAPVLVAARDRLLRRGAAKSHSMK